VRDPWEYFCDDEEEENSDGDFKEDHLQCEKRDGEAAFDGVSPK
jgi:hypothetical protein